MGIVASGIDDAVVVNPSGVRPATAEQVAAAESELGVRMPDGYAQYVQRFGEGALGHFVRVYLPHEVPSKTLEWRERIEQYWFWDTVEAGVEAQALQQRGIVLADSFDGDELCFDPADPQTLFVLPRAEDVAQRVGPGFVAALEWMLSGALNPWVEGWTFEAGTGRSRLNRAFPGQQLARSADAIEALGEHSHVVDLGERRTFFLPPIQGRLSLYQFPGEDLSIDLSYDESASSTAIDRLLATIAGAGETR